MRKYEECEDCAFDGVEPALCDMCEDGDQFEPADPDDDAFDILRNMAAPARVIPIIPVGDDHELVEQAA